MAGFEAQARQSNDVAYGNFAAVQSVTPDVCAWVKNGHGDLGVETTQMTLSDIESPRLSSVI